MNVLRELLELDQKYISFIPCQGEYENFILQLFLRNNLIKKLDLLSQSKEIKDETRLLALELTY